VAPPWSRVCPAARRHSCGFALCRGPVVAGFPLPLSMSGDPRLPSRPRATSVTSCLGARLFSFRSPQPRGVSGHIPQRGDPQIVETHSVPLFSGCLLYTSSNAGVGVGRTVRKIRAVSIAFLGVCGGQCQSPIYDKSGCAAFRLPPNNAQALVALKQPLH